MSIDMFPDSFVQYCVKEAKKIRRGVVRVDHCNCPPDHPAHTQGSKKIALPA